MHYKNWVFLDLLYSFVLSLIVYVHILVLFYRAVIQIKCIIIDK